MPMRFEKRILDDDHIHYSLTDTDTGRGFHIVSQKPFNTDEEAQAYLQRNFDESA